MQIWKSVIYTEHYFINHSAYIQNIFPTKEEKSVK